MKKLSTENILGHNILSDKASNFFKHLDLLLNNQLVAKKNFWFSCMNAHSYAVAKKDKIFLESLQSSDYIIPDGSGFC